MKTKILRLASIAALGAIAFAACDAAPPTEAPAPTPVPETVETKALAALEPPPEGLRADLADIVMDDDAFSRARRLGTLLPTLGPEAIPAVVQTLDDRTVALGATEYELLIRFWAGHDGEAAARWAKEDSTSPFFQPATLLTAITAWAEADPAGAASTTREWADDHAFESIVPVGVTRGWYAANDSSGLKKYLRSLPPSIFRQRSIAAFVHNSVEKEGADAVMAWAESLPDEDDDAIYKQAVFRRVIDALSLLDTDAAMRWCDAQCLGPYGSNMRSLIGRNWVLRDGPAALAWLSTGPEGNDRDLAVRLTFALWIRKDREPAVAWMRSQTTGEPPVWLNTAFPVYSRFIVEESPEEALRLTERIVDERTREVVTIKAARVWLYLDEAAAEAWLAESWLSEEARAKVRVPVKDPPAPAG